jgi:hypothetical protein
MNAYLFELLHPPYNTPYNDSVDIANIYNIDKSKSHIIIPILNGYTIHIINDIKNVNKGAIT